MIGRIALCALIALPVCAQHEKVEQIVNRGGGDGASIPAENIDPELVPLGLSAEEKQDLLVFMYALTDSTIALHVPVRVPSGLPPAGVYQLAWDGHHEGGLAVASGVYLVSAQMGGVRYLARMTLVH